VVSTRNPRNPLSLRTVVSALVVGSIALLLPVGAARAIDPGIHFDPGGPSKKEYAIPLAQGRAEGAGTTNQHAGNTLFGVGIGPPGGGGGGRSGTGGGGPFGTGRGGPLGTGSGGGSVNGGGGGSGGASRSAGGGGSGKVTGGSGATGPGHKAGHAKGTSSSTGAADLRRIADAEHTGGTGIWNVGIILAVVLPAVLFALLLRRRPRHRQA
jgi:hypothetical protein